MGHEGPSGSFLLQGAAGNYRALKGAATACVGPWLVEWHVPIIGFLIALQLYIATYESGSGWPS